MLFYKRNVTHDSPDNVFDAIMLVSTIERIVINVYDQLVIDEHGHVRAMRGLRRMPKPFANWSNSKQIGWRPTSRSQFLFTDKGARAGA
jgi:hypothetical protein